MVRITRTTLQLSDALGGVQNSVFKNEVKLTIKKERLRVGTFFAIELLFLIYLFKALTFLIILARYKELS